GRTGRNILSSKELRRVNGHWLGAGRNGAWEERCLAPRSTVRKAPETLGETVPGTIPTVHGVESGGSMTRGRSRGLDEALMEAVCWVGIPRFSTGCQAATGGMGGGNVGAHTGSGGD